MNRREAIAALMSIPAATRISVAQLTPDDVIVVETDAHLTMEQATWIRSSLEYVWPGRKCVVLVGSMKLKVVQG